MLIPQATLARIATGELDLVFRRWKRPTVKAGGTLKTSQGLLAVDAVEACTMARLTADDARRSGYPSRKALVEALRKHRGRLYRVQVHLAGPDPRIVLRNTLLDDAGEAELATRLGRLERRGPWTQAHLEAIEAQPGVRAGDLAEGLGRERLDFKKDVRKLKNLGLTESLKIGYRLSPRGESWLARVRARKDR